PILNITPCNSDTSSCPDCHRSPVQSQAVALTDTRSSTRVYRTSDHQTGDGRTHGSHGHSSPLRDLPTSHDPPADDAGFAGDQSVSASPAAQNLPVAAAQGLPDDWSSSAHRPALHGSRRRQCWLRPPAPCDG